MSNLKINEKIVLNIVFLILGGKMSREPSSISLKGGTKNAPEGDTNFQLGEAVWVAGTKKGTVR